jgi:hypothetical protein
MKPVNVPKTLGLKLISNLISIIESILFHQSRCNSFFYPIFFNLNANSMIEINFGTIFNSNALKN